MESGRDGVRVTRRRFVAAGAMGGAVLAVACAGGKRGNWDFLTADQAGVLQAICDQIVPADDYPSASQAGVLNYIDRQLARTYRRYRNAYRDGLAQADALARQHCGAGMAALSPRQQLEITLALERENRSFFDLVRGHTLEGYYGSPRHGGNRNAVSWHMLGLTEPPVRGRAQYDLRKGAGA